MSVWIGNLINHLKDRPVAILYGNVRDVYIDGIHKQGVVYPDLTSLLRMVANRLSREGDLPLQEMQFFDPSGMLRRTALQAEESPPGKANPEDPPPNFPDPQVLIARWTEEMREHRDPRMGIIYYLDKLVQYSTQYQEKDRKILYHLERLIENIVPEHRLVLVGLRDTMVPVELYFNSPKVFVQAIPEPDTSDRRAFLNHRLDRGANNQEERERIELLAVLSEGLYLRDLDRIVKTLKNTPVRSTDDVRRLLNQYRFGKQEDYFGKLDIRKIDNLVPWFEKEEGVKGQTESITRLTEVLTIARAGLSGVASGTTSKPKGALFFAGPSGVGKTLVAKKLAKFLFGDETAFLRFDMSEFKEEHTVSKLIGSPPGYVGSDEGGMLTNGVRQKPFSVVLFDEIEKAHPKIMDIFLQILDDGRLTDSRGQTVFFTECIIVFTSNIGTRSQQFRDLDGAVGSPPTGEKADSGNHIENRALEAIRADTSIPPEERKKRIREHFEKCVRAYFQQEISRPELLNRFGRNIIPFNFIDDEEIQYEIFSHHLKRISREVEDIYRTRGHRINIDPALPRYLAAKHGDRLKDFGARGIVDCLESEVVLPLSKMLLRTEIELPDARELAFRLSIFDDTVIVRVGGKQ